MSFTSKTEIEGKFGITIDCNNDIVLQIFNGKSPDNPCGKSPDNPCGKSPDNPCGKSPDNPCGKFKLNKTSIAENDKLLLVFAQYNQCVLNSDSINNLLFERIMELNNFNLIMDYASILLQFNNVNENEFLNIIELYNSAIKICEDGMVDYHVKNGNLANNYAKEYMRLKCVVDNNDCSMVVDNNDCEMVVNNAKNYLQSYDSLKENLLLPILKQYNFAKFKLATFYINYSIGDYEYVDLGNKIMMKLVKDNYLPAIIEMGNYCLKINDGMGFFNYYVRAIDLVDDVKVNLIMDELKLHLGNQILLGLLKKVKGNDRILEEVRKMEVNL